MLRKGELSGTTKQHCRALFGLKINGNRSYRVINPNCIYFFPPIIINMFKGNQKRGINMCLQPLLQHNRGLGLHFNQWCGGSWENWQASD